jgi:hypothetical protein
MLPKESEKKEYTYSQFVNEFFPTRTNTRNKNPQDLGKQIAKEIALEVFNPTKKTSITEKLHE